VTLEKNSGIIKIQEEKSKKILYFIKKVKQMEKKLEMLPLKKDIETKKILKQLVLV